MRGGRLSSASPVAVNVTSSGVGVPVAPVVAFGVVVVPGVVVLGVVGLGVVVFGVGLVGVRVTIHDPTRNCAVDGVVGVGVGMVVVCARASEAAVASDATTVMIVRMLGLP
jgi:hypothetical protein